MCRANVVDAMLDLDSFFDNEELNDNYDFNYIGWIQEWSQGKGYGLPDYEHMDNYNGEYTCLLTIRGDDGLYL